MNRLLLTALIGLAAISRLVAGADDDWRQLNALESAPAGNPKTADEARALTFSRLANQESALRKYLAQYPSDAHTYEARLRLAHVLALRSGMASDAAAAAESAKILDTMESDAATPPARKADAAFARIVIHIERARSSAEENRDALLEAAHGFQKKYPSDNRAGGLLAEVASLFDAEPKKKFDILQDALRSAKDEELRLRIGDDLKRVAMFGRPVALHFTATNGKAIDVKELRGKVVVVYFFAGWSIPSLHEMDHVRQMLAQFPREKVQPLGISLDRDAAALNAVLRREPVDWPIALETKGWESPLVRGFGINAVPTTWVLDRRGRLRALNARDDLDSVIRALLREL